MLLTKFFFRPNHTSRCLSFFLLHKTGLFHLQIGLHDIRFIALLRFLNLTIQDKTVTIITIYVCHFPSLYEMFPITTAFKRKNIIWKKTVSHSTHIVGSFLKPNSHHPLCLRKKKKLVLITPPQQLNTVCAVFSDTVTCDVRL